LRGFGKDFLLEVAQNRVLLSANYVSRSFGADGSEIIEKHEVCFFVLHGNLCSNVDFNAICGIPCKRARVCSAKSAYKHCMSRC